MNPVLRNVLAVIAGAVVGSIVNMSIVKIGPSIIPPPEGADLTTVEGLKAAMPLMEAKHFVTPFLAHALGTLVGAFVAVKIAVSNHMKLGLLIGVFFLMGGIAASTMIPSPTWFIALDLIAAYIPMAWIGGKLASK